MSAWKCTKCCAMVEESEMENHICTSDHNLMPATLRARPGGQGGCNLTGQVAAAMELTRLRAEQRAWDEARALRRKAKQEKETVE